MAKTADTSREEWELVLNLCRIFPLKITFPDITKPEKQRELVQQVMEFQEDFLRKMHAFEENFMNFHQDLQKVPLRIKTFDGYRPRTIRSLRKDHADLVKRYYDTLDTLIDLFPHLPPVRFVIPDHATVPLIREFEREANAVYVEPLRTITGVLLFDIYRIWTDDGSMYLPTYLNVHAADLDKSSLIRLKLRMVGPLESKAVFNPSFAPERVCNLINAIQGQMGGHVNRLFSLLKSRDLAAYVRDSLQRIKDNILPEVMTAVRPDLEGILAMEERLFQARGAQERVCLKDELLDGARRLDSVDLRNQDDLDDSVFADLNSGIAAEGLRRLFRDYEVQLSPNAPVTVARPGTEWMLTDVNNLRYIVTRERHRLEIFADTQLNRAHRSILGLMTDGIAVESPERTIQAIVGNLEGFARRVRELPAATLTRKHALLRTALRRSLPAAGQLFDAYLQVCEKSYKAVHPFMGMVSFAPGGMSDFYVKWFAGLKDFLEFDVLKLKERARALPPAIDGESRAYADKENIEELLTAAITPAVAAAIRFSRLAALDDEEEEENDQPERLSAAELVELLADFFCLISCIHSLPREIYRIERDIFYNIRKKRTFALKLVRSGRKRDRSSDSYTGN